MWQLQDYLGTIGVTLPVLVVGATAFWLMRQRLSGTVSFVVAAGMCAGVLVTYGVVADGDELLSAVRSVLTGPIQWLLVWLPLVGMASYAGIAGARRRAWVFALVGLACMLVGLLVLTGVVLVLSSARP